MKTRTVDTSEQIHDRRNCKNFFHKKTGIFQKKYALLQVRVSQLSARVPVGMVAGGLVVRSVGGSVGGGGVGSAMWHEPSTAFTRLSAGVSAKFTLLHNTQQTVADVRLCTPPSVAPGESVCQPTLLTARHSPGCQQECQQRSLYYTTHSTEN